MLVSAAEMLKKAKAGHYAVGQFNINNLEWTKSILATAQECNSPVILGVSEGAGKYMGGYKAVVGMVNGLLEENIAVTKEVADYAHAHNISVEAEIGHVGGDEAKGSKEVLYADLNECVRMVKETGVDCLTPALGSVHGDYKGEPKLGFDEMQAISEATNVSKLVSHQSCSMVHTMQSKRTLLKHRN